MQNKNQTIEKLIQEARKNNSQKAIKSIQKAYETTKKNSTQKQLQHSLNSAMILAQQELDSESIKTALLIGTKQKQTKKEFGKETENLLEQCEKINQIIKTNKNKIQPQKLGKIVLAIARDIRALLIILAEEIEQLRHIKTLTKEEQKNHAELSMKLFVPISHKLGLENIKWELEDLSFKFSNPKEYNKIKNQIKTSRQEREKQVNEIVDKVKEQLKKHNIKAKVLGRPKSFYSTYQKMNKKKVPIENISDLNALRIICNTEKDCYSTLGLIHSTWEPITTEFDDYISNPKKTGYKSIHTYFKTKNQKIFEAQIRTWSMHIEAEEGVAAHWAYKKFQADPYFDPKLKWAKSIIQWFKGSKETNTITGVNLELDYDKIFVLTPNSEIIELPKKSTPIDFAYSVHSGIGEKTIKAIVNGKIEKLDYVIKSGDVINVLTSPKSKPQRKWLNFVKTHKAKTKIRQALNIVGIGKIKDKFKKIKPILKTKKKIITAKCCSPLPGETVIGINTTKRKIVVHKENCQNLEKIDKKKLIKLDWGAIKQKNFQTNIYIEAIDRVNLLNDLMKTLSKTNTKIQSTNANISGQLAKTMFKISIKNQQEMNTLLENLSRVKGVKKAQRQ